MCQLVQAKSISSRLELASLATAQVREGKTVLAEFIANRGSKAVDEVIQLIKEFAKAETHLNRFKKTSIELLEEELTGKCLQLRKSYSSATRLKSIHLSFERQLLSHFSCTVLGLKNFFYTVLTAHTIQLCTCKYSCSSSPSTYWF